jgi:hypothetical protein
MLIHRFNPDGQCLQVALDFVLSYFEDTQLPQDIIALSNDYKTIFQFMAKKRFCFVTPIPLGSLLFSNFWTLFFRFSGHFVSSRKYANIKKQLANTQTRYVVLGEDTAKRLYGLSREYWSHFVVFYNDMEDNTLHIFDPLKPILENESGIPINTSYEVDKLLFKLLIWKENNDRF